MRPVRAPADRVPVDYAPSRIAYRVNRLWLSPWIRIGVKWVLPLAAVSGLGWIWVQQPGTQALIATIRTEVLSTLRDQPDFQVPLMEIHGAGDALASEIRAAIGITFPVSVLDLDLTKIHDTVAAFDAIKEVDARVMLGGALVVTVTERAPVAIWRTSWGLELLDIDGHRVGFTDSRDGAPDLPLIVADGADQAVAEALAIFEAAQPIADRVRGLKRQGERRWDVILVGGQVIQLPEKDPVPLLERVIAVHQAGQLLDRDIQVIDMRNVNRPTIRLGEEAVAYLGQMRDMERGLKR